jgi:hypothetical protein
MLPKCKLAFVISAVVLSCGVSAAPGDLAAARQSAEAVNRRELMRMMVMKPMAKGMSMKSVPTKSPTMKPTMSPTKFPINEYATCTTEHTCDTEPPRCDDECRCNTNTEGWQNATLKLKDAPVLIPVWVPTNVRWDMIACMVVAEPTFAFHCASLASCDEQVGKYHAIRFIPSKDQIKTLCSKFQCPSE